MITKEPCPSCRDKGEDRSGDNFARYPDGGGKCFKCGYKEGRSNNVSNQRSFKLPLHQVLSYPNGVDPARGVGSDVGTLYDTRVTINEESGDVDQVIYPYYDNGVITGAKIRTIAGKKFSVSGSLPPMFGKQACKGGSILILTEGEEDALATKEILARSNPPKKYDVVSLSGATPSKEFYEESEFFSSYNRVFVCMDADEAGRTCSTEVADYISTVTETRVVALDKSQGKDPSDYLKAGLQKEFLDKFTQAPKYEPEGIVNGTDISLDWLLEPIHEGYVLQYPMLQDKLHGLRKAEITTLCAGSGIGKTTLAREITKELIEQGCSVANVALEDQMQVTAQGLVALDMDVPLSSFRFNPPPKSETQASFDKLISNGRTYFWKHFGGINADSLMKKLYYYAQSKKCDFIVLDHLSIVVSATDTNNERKAIDTLMTQLAKLVVQTGVGLIQIVHLKRPSGDKSFAKGGEVELSDLRGSAALEQLSWNVIGLERDQQGDSRDFSRIRVLKNRTCGFTGACDTLKYNPQTGRLLPFTEPAEALDTEALSEEIR